MKILRKIFAFALALIPCLILEYVAYLIAFSVSPMIFKHQSSAAFDFGCFIVFVAICVAIVGIWMFGAILDKFKGE